MDQCSCPLPASKTKQGPGLSPQAPIPISNSFSSIHAAARSTACLPDLLSLQAYPSTCINPGDFPLLLLGAPSAASPAASTVSGRALHHRGNGLIFPTKNPPPPLAKPPPGPRKRQSGFGYQSRCGTLQRIRPHLVGLLPPGPPCKQDPDHILQRAAGCRSNHAPPPRSPLTTVV